MEDIRGFVMEYVEKNGKIPQGAALTDDFDYSRTGAIDSVGMFKFIVTLECRYDIEIPDEALTSPGFTTIGGLSAIIQKLLADNRNIPITGISRRRSDDILLQGYDVD
ncbi:MAG: acyl carrier protein [Synergistaceae bacterium]|jgi:acyl carrier protein|nr:acyl carrier protein [Synergistaceae bacterium]